MEAQQGDYKKLLTELIRKQIVVLGPEIALSKVKSIQGIEVDASGEVLMLSGNPQEILQNLINQFVELSGLIVKRTMESILSSYQVAAGIQNKNGVNPQAQEINRLQEAPQPVVPIQPARDTSQGVAGGASIQLQVPTPQAAPSSPSMDGFSQEQISQLNQMIQEINNPTAAKPQLSQAPATA